MGSGGSGGASGGGAAVGRSGTGGASGWGGSPGGTGYGGDLGAYGTAGEMSGGAGGAGMAGYGGGGLAGVKGSGWGGSGGAAGRQTGVIGQGPAFGMAQMAPGYYHDPQTGAVYSAYSGKSLPAGTITTKNPSGGLTISSPAYQALHPEMFSTQTNPLTVRPGQVVTPGLLQANPGYRTRPGVDPGMQMSPDTFNSRQNSFGMGNLTGPAPMSGSTGGPNRQAKSDPAQSVNRGSMGPPGGYRGY